MLVAKHWEHMDTDSVASNTKVISNKKDVEIEKLFLNNVRDEGDIHYIDDSEYIFPKGITSMTYDPDTGESHEMEIDYIYRHKVDKDMYEIEDEEGNVVVVTGDHSLMVERNGDMLSITPNQLDKDDILISL